MPGWRSNYNLCQWWEGWFRTRPMSSSSYQWTNANEYQKMIQKNSAQIFTSVYFSISSISISNHYLTWLKMHSMLKQCSCRSLSAEVAATTSCGPHPSRRQNNCHSLSTLPLGSRNAVCFSLYFQTPVPRGKKTNQGCQCSHKKCFGDKWYWDTDTDIDLVLSIWIYLSIESIKYHPEPNLAIKMIHAYQFIPNGQTWKHPKTKWRKTLVLKETEMTAAAALKSKVERLASWQLAAALH